MAGRDTRSLTTGPGAARRVVLVLSSLFCVVLSGCTTPASIEPTGQATLAIVGGSIIDPTSDAPARPGTLLISGSRISAVLAGEKRPANARIVDARGKYIVPALWDMHAHLATGAAAERAPERYVAHGVLAVRDMGGHLAVLQKLRAQIAGGRIAPTVVMAGHTLNGEASAPFHRLVRTDGEARAAVRELAAAGVDFIKIHRRTGAEAFKAIADETRRLGIGFGGHVPLVMRWPDAAAAGMRSIEHIQTLLENEMVTAADPVEATFRTLELVQGPRGTHIFAALARHGTYFTPTLIYFERTWQRDTPERRQMKQRLYSGMQPLVGRASRIGVRVLAGTDLFDADGIALLQELERLVQAGLSPRQALAAATENARAAAGRGPGRIARGEEASLLIVDADPRANIANLRQLSALILRGRFIEGQELEELRR